mmetsp:Transcript_40650/g.49475  ORF Transcript_40650/g.49475 Transcript_40650/m.49475 type:complete len:210 (-) Transcript_40650:378-1007(-)
MPLHHAKKIRMTRHLPRKILHLLASNIPVFLPFQSFSVMIGVVMVVTPLMNPRRSTRILHLVRFFPSLLKPARHGRQRVTNKVHVLIHNLGHVLRRYDIFAVVSLAGVTLVMKLFPVFNVRFRHARQTVSPAVRPREDVSVGGYWKVVAEREGSVRVSFEDGNTHDVVRNVPAVLSHYRLTVVRTRRERRHLVYGTLYKVFPAPRETHH